MPLTLRARVAPMATPLAFTCTAVDPERDAVAYVPLSLDADVATPGPTDVYLDYRTASIRDVDRRKPSGEIAIDKPPERIGGLGQSPHRQRPAEGAASRASGAPCEPRSSTPHVR